MPPKQIVQGSGDVKAYFPAPGEFKMAWICPLVVEEKAAVAALTTEYAVDKDDYLQIYKLKGDRNIYTLGKVKSYNIVICRPSDTRAGPIIAAMAWRDLQRSFSNLEHFLIVGIAGGAPSICNKPDIRLGDVVIGLQDKAHPGMIQIDAGWQKQSFESTINICPPPAQLQLFAERLISWPNERHSKRAGQFKETAKEILAKLGWDYPGVSMDCCFQANSKCRNSRNCPEACQKYCRQVCRPPRDEGFQQIHGGLICSSSKVIKDAKYRDQVIATNSRNGKAQILAFETEGYGVASQIQCLNIRGISDYADSHKNSRWQPYAAVNAVAAAKIITILLVEQSLESHPLGLNCCCTASSSIYTQKAIPKNFEADPNTLEHIGLSISSDTYIRKPDEVTSQHKEHTQAYPIYTEQLSSPPILDSDSFKQYDDRQQSLQVGLLSGGPVPSLSNEPREVNFPSKRYIPAPSKHDISHTVSNQARSIPTRHTTSSRSSSIPSQYTVQSQRILPPRLQSSSG